MWWAEDVVKSAAEEANLFSIDSKEFLSSKDLFELINKNLFHLEKVKYVPYLLSITFV